MKINIDGTMIEKDVPSVEVRIDDHEFVIARVAFVAPIPLDGIKPQYSYLIYHHGSGCIWEYPPEPETSVVFILHGEDWYMAARQGETLADVRARALRASHNSGPAERWEIRNELGYLLDPKTDVMILPRRVRLFLTLRIGVGAGLHGGGSVPAQSPGTCDHEGGKEEG